MIPLIPWQQGQRTLPSILKCTVDFDPSKEFLSTAKSVQSDDDLRNCQQGGWAHRCKKSYNGYWAGGRAVREVELIRIFLIRVPSSTSTVWAKADTPGFPCSSNDRFSLAIRLMWSLSFDQFISPLWSEHIHPGRTLCLARVKRGNYLKGYSGCTLVSLLRGGGVGHYNSIPTIHELRGH